jgi:hypothetical protein
VEKANGLLWEVSLWEFIFVTICLGGGAAFLTGRAVARSWHSYIELVIDIVLLTAATRFIHFSLFRGTLTSVHYFVVDLIVLMAIAFLGHRMTRSKQLSKQYSFMYKRKSLLGWEPK